MAPPSGARGQPSPADAATGALLNPLGHSALVQMGSELPLFQGHLCKLSGGPRARWDEGAAGSWGGWVRQWWGDPPDHDPRPTLEYAKRTVAQVCQDFGGDTERVVLMGFSRGAIACGFLGLHDDEVALVPDEHLGAAGAPSAELASRLLRPALRACWRAAAHLD